MLPRISTIASGNIHGTMIKDKVERTKTKHAAVVNLSAPAFTDRAVLK